MLVGSFHVYTYHIGYLLPGSAASQHALPALYNFRQHNTPATNNPDWTETERHLIVS
ncbi:TPA: hypothetical protein OZR47_000314 [Escherichia coli]|nr:hypothetical protein [Escherichia coli]